MLLIQVITTVLLALGCIAWVWIFLAALRSRRSVPRVAALDFGNAERWPKVSVIVPVRNGADRIEACCAALQASDYPDLEILLVDDRSDDGTGELTVRLAAGDGRIRPLCLGRRAEGWLGKTHAMHQAVGQAKGEWILFTNVDSEVQPGAIQQALRWAFNDSRDHVALIPETRSTNPWTGAVVMAGLRALLVGLRPWAVRDERSDAFAGSGAFNLVKRSVVERNDGLGGLCLDTCDGLALGRIVKESGGRSGLGSGAGLVSVAGHETQRSLVRAWERRVWPLMGCRTTRLALVVAALALIELSPWLCLTAMSIPMLGVLGAVGAAGLIGTSVVTALWLGRPVAHAVAAPLGSVIMLATLIRAGVLGRLLGGIHWSGTIYRSEELRLGASVTLPLWPLPFREGLAALLSFPRSSVEVRTS